MPKPYIHFGTPINNSPHPPTIHFMNPIRSEFHLEFTLFTDKIVRTELVKYKFCKPIVGINESV